MMSIFSRYKYIAVILVAQLVLFFANYKPGTFLVGWDNVYPELNFSENITRGLFSVWQQYRGLGVVDGMAHAALLPHTIAVWLLSLVFPLNTLRYIIQFSLHFLGGLGIFLLLRNLLDKKNTHNSQLFSLLGGLFYMFNLVTVQMFYTPLEVFSYHFAFLPLLIHASMKFLEQGHLRALLWFVTLSILSLPQAHVPSVFLVYAGALTIICTMSAIFSSNRKKTIGLVALLCATTVAVNAYWGLPYIYTTLHASKTIVESKINQMSTDNVVLRNKAFGDFTSVALLRGFTLDFVDFQRSGKNAYMLEQWRVHIRRFPIYLVSIAAFICTIIGMFAMFVKREKRFYPFSILFIGAFLMLGNGIPVLSLISDLIQQYVPLFYNVFRFTFTKFSIIYAFAYSIFLAFGLRHILSFVRLKKLTPFIIVGCIALIVPYSLPTFSGGFFYDNLRLKIPKDYFEVIKLFKSLSKETRVAVLPQPSYWGWVYYGWGARGSGFLWYGLPTATLDGAFYPWSKQNENLYWELSRAIYTKNAALFDKVLDKYQVDYIIVDRSLQSPFSPKALFTEQTVNLIKQVRQTDSPLKLGYLDVFAINGRIKHNSFVYLLHNTPMVLPQYNWGSDDRAYFEYGGYFSSFSEPTTHLPLPTTEVYYPFRTLFTGRTQKDLEFKIREEGDWYIFEKPLTADLKNAELVVPTIIAEEVLEQDIIDISNTTAKFPQIFLNGKEILYSKENRQPAVIRFNTIRKGTIQVRVPKIRGLYSLDTQINGELSQKEPENCEQFNRGFFTLEKKDDDGKYLRFTSIGSNNCMDIHVQQAFQRLGYIVSVSARNIEGTSLLFNIFNESNSRPEIETYLPQSTKSTRSRGFTKSYFILPPLDDYGFGYNLHFDNVSVGKIKTLNDLQYVAVNPIPYRFLTELKIVKRNNQQTATNNIQLTSVDHPNPSYYQITYNREQITNNNLTTLVLSQSFDSGWHAYEISDQSPALPAGRSAVSGQLVKMLPFLFGKELKDHVLVNNWSNGWQISGQLSASSVQLSNSDNQQQRTIIIVYLPQYLQYLGFAMLGGFLIYLLLRWNQTRRIDRQPHKDVSS